MECWILAEGGGVLDPVCASVCASLFNFVFSDVKLLAKISHDKNIYTMEIGKLCKIMLDFFFLKSHWLM